jgi:hypothetical protein
MYTGLAFEVQQSEILVTNRRRITTSFHLIPINEKKGGLRRKLQSLQHARELL